MSEGWFDERGDWINPTSLAPLEEILARLSGHHRGEIQAFLWSAARWEQNLQPYVLPKGDVRLAKELLNLPAERAAVEESLSHMGLERALTVLRRVVTEWNDPVQVQEQVYPYLQRRHDDVLWLLEEVGIGVTGVPIRMSVSGPLPDTIPYRVFWPRPVPYLEESERLDTWWRGFWDTRLTDDVGTQYRSSGSATAGAENFPLRVLVDGRAEARVKEGYVFTFVPGVPPNARSLTLTGRVDLSIEHPLTDSPPWPKVHISLGDFSYTIDLTGWWPDAIRTDESLQ